jgi:hypothetical protein
MGPLMGPGLGTPTQTITARNCDIETAICQFELWF